MPFGAVFASLLLGLVGVFLPLSALGAGSAPTALGRVALGLICLNVSIGLMRRQPWARWGALFAALVLLLLNDLLAPPGGAVAKLAILFGGVISILLLALPPTGKLTPTDHPQRIGGLAVASVLGVVALGVSLVWGTLTPSPESRATESPIRISGLSPRVSWKDFGSGIELAATNSKPLFVVFETSWCGYCRKMNRSTFKDPGVVERLNELVAVKINAEDDEKINGYSGRELAARYGVAGYPALMVLGPGGQVRSRTSGYLDARDFLAWVEKGIRSGSQSAS
ncbi:MAG: thioredoxin fold domain-containing protein [Acidobacteria bacterium]|nr:thioredoxin fold domain-containing protein [Acidobacteriota bacterium]NIM62541.1 thioredoxin fold domain-containing protein [Acidobacteriota bacterium]NIO58274.1 thioredoxin fold domain-containing protein [Acidobacteriota bacterium]NIQ29330.1 thioredoxin fold domain-containing protein [Acidobacteriota bacterium]NIQ83930.1 thioredoxin fold domain-containing protein [Acidobacteriota bacterium]